MMPALCLQIYAQPRVTYDLVIVKLDRFMPLRGGLVPQYKFICFENNYSIHKFGKR